MGSSPPLLYLTDDDDDNEMEHNFQYGHPVTAMLNENLPRKKRKLANTNVRINPSIVNWSKRQRNNHYDRPSNPTHDLMNQDRDVLVYNPNDYNLEDQESHSFHAFDWSSEPRTSNRMHQHPILLPSRISVLPRPPPPPSNVMNVVKHQLNHTDTMPLMPMTHRNDRYIEQSHRKTISIPRCSSSPSTLPLPLPTQTSSIIRPTAQRVQVGKNLGIPFTHSLVKQSQRDIHDRSNPGYTFQTSSPLVPVRRQAEPIFPQSYHPQHSTPVVTPTATPEIRRQALNGTGTLSAFYDSKCYRCNICKFKSITSTTLLQHLFTHIFFCHHCSFYTYSHHNLYQHIFEKHNFNPYDDNTDPKMLELLYLTRCPDGTFALCMDSSPPKPPTPIVSLPKPDEPPPVPSPTTAKAKKVTKPKAPRRKPTKSQKKEEDNDIVILSEKRDTDSQPSSSSSLSSSSVTPKRPLFKEKPVTTYVLMKYRRCYSIKHPPCLHSLTLEYNICREHTIRHMSHTQDLSKRQKYKPKSDIIRLIDVAAKCLKTIVNDVVNMEEKSSSLDVVSTLPNNILNLIFQKEDLNILTNSLKLSNKYDKTRQQNDQYGSERPVRTSTEHVFIVSAAGINKNEQTIFASLNSSITHTDTALTQTKLKKLPVSYDNTHRFLKGTLHALGQSPTTNSNLSEKNNSESVRSPVTKSTRQTSHSSSSLVDKNNNSVTSSAPSVIVLD